MPAWDRRDSETAKSHHAFTLYLRLGPTRTLDEVRKALDRPPGYLRVVKEWSRTHDWVARAAAYDEWLERAYHERDREQAAAMAERQAELGRMAQELARSELDHYRHTAKARADLLAAKLADETFDEDVDAWLLEPVLTPTELARLLDTGVKVERLAMGAYTELVGNTAVEELPDEELARIIAEDPELTRLIDDAHRT